MTIPIFTRDSFRIQDGPAYDEGTFGIIKKAYLADRPVAVKIRKPKKKKYQAIVDVMYMREIDALEICGVKHPHPNVLRLLYYDPMCMITEWCDGKTWVDVAGKWEKDRCAIAAAELLSAIAHVHAHGWLHRDVSTKNIFLTDRGVTKLGDFGTARELIPHRAMTRVVTTRWYRHPKLLDDYAENYIEYGTEVDEWSAACCIAELYSGVVQFQGTSDLHQLKLAQRKQWIGVSDADVLNQLNNLTTY